ncbi:ABATE domain-containing protein [Streptomyces sp. NBC_00091]|uniref:CGNR zinc finger domain-containing protein n=1 Tax=Streptomyces sp. NBC_00091 TaxID=2975648 RepID=UPI0022518DAB|nr:ABATE domain-containing protein [Streptomyces sp. NBC_00091]MCX5380553.1 ABATE domain-containing protein [Streptomyces sp. NBC_00091]
MSESAERSPVDEMPLVGESLALDLVNTTFIDGGLRGVLVDALATPADLDRWCARRLEDFSPPLRSRLTEPATRAHFERFLELRHALREVAAAHVAGRAPEPADVRTVNLASRLAARWEELAAAPEPLGAVTRWAEPDPRLAALGEVAAAGVRLFGGAPGRPVNACPAPGCILYFVKTHARREWCTATCGNRVRVARHSRRHREPAAG